VAVAKGKQLRRSRDATSGKATLTLDNVWARTNRLTLDYAVVEPGSNEMPEIPDLQRYVVTLDTKICQTEIVAELVA
jgi:hypothetical protein